MIKLGAILVGLSVVISACKQEKGCLDITALNYNPDAFKDDGSCLYSLETPVTYQFNRFQQSSVKYDEQIGQQLLLNDLQLKVAALAAPGASSIDTNLIALYEGDAAAIITANPIGNALPTAYVDIASSLNLSSLVSATYSADSIIYAALAIIQNNSLNIALLGSAGVHTSAEGIDVWELCKGNILGAGFFRAGVNELLDIENQSHETLVEEEAYSYTPRESAWDAAFGWYGAAIAFNNYTDEGLADASELYQDDDSDGTINLLSEYNYSFPQLAAQRDLIYPDGIQSIDFTNDLFSLFIQGRTQITNRQDSLLSITRNTLVYKWEQLLAATAVHHLNATKAELDNLSNPTELNKNWSAALAYLQALQYRSIDNSNLFSASELLDLLGTTRPNYEAGTPEYEDYLNQLNEILEIIRPAYEFSEFQMENW